MGSLTIKVLAVVLLLAVGFTARWTYEEITSPDTTAVAQQQDDPRTGLDCVDYESQAAAQQALREDPSDPNVLDEDNDGIACETFDYPPGTDRDETPVPAAVGSDDFLSDDDFISGDQDDDTTTTRPSRSNQNANVPRRSDDDRATQRRNNRGSNNLLRAGGPTEPPYPTLMNGECPKEFPVKQDNGCYPR